MVRRNEDKDGAAPPKADPPLAEKEEDELEIRFLSVKKWAFKLCVVPSGINRETSVVDSRSAGDELAVRRRRGVRQMPLPVFYRGGGGALDIMWSSAMGERETYMRDG